jgi:hypothetical protein
MVAILSRVRYGFGPRFIGGLQAASIIDDLT